MQPGMYGQGLDLLNLKKYLTVIVCVGVCTMRINDISNQSINHVWFGTNQPAQ